MRKASARFKVQTCLGSGVVAMHVRSCDGAPLAVCMNGRSPHWLLPVARAGFASKGAVYLVLGGLAVLSALGDRRGKLAGSGGAVRAIGEQPFGRILLIVAGLGLAAYALWKVVFVVLNPEGASGIKGAGKRAGYAISALGHTGLAVLSLQLALGESTGGSSARIWVTRIMDAPFGRVVVAAVGLGLCGYAAFQLYCAASGRLPRTLPGASEARRPWLDALGRAGLGSRGIVLGIIGYRLVSAGLQGRARESQDVGGALRELTLLPEGTFVLGVVAMGLAAYGVYMLACAAFARHGGREQV